MGTLFNAKGIPATREKSVSMQYMQANAKGIPTTREKSVPMQYMQAIIKELNMRKEKLILLITILSTVVNILILNLSSVQAADIPTQPEPKKLRVEPINNTPPNIEPPIGYNEYDEYYVDLRWDSLENPVPNIVINKYMNFYLQEISKPYKKTKPIILKKENVIANSNSSLSLRMDRLSSGTIYYTYAKAYYTYTEELSDIVYKSKESLSSNMVKFLTGIKLEAYPHGVKQIKIIWDDVWDSSSRIKYKLYISEDKSFTNTPAIYIESNDIGVGRPVTVNEDDGKLEYVHTVRDPGRVYYVKIVPDIIDNELKRSNESNVVAVSSYILAKTTKMSSTSEGTIWKIEWNPVVTGLNTGDVEVSYHIYRGILDSNDFPNYVAAVDDTVFITTLSPEDENNYYFIIRAFVTRNGEELYPGIKIESDKIIIKESEVPSSPSKPELVNEFKGRRDDIIISYDDQLKPDEATILWRLPETGKGEIDTNIRYDIWLIEDPNTIDNPALENKVADSVKMTQQNYVLDGSNLIGYKYVLSNLNPNSVYYFRVIAKKSFIDYNKENLEEKTISSEPAIRVIKTPTEDISAQPVVPGRPPLKLKEDPQSPGKFMVTGTTAIIQLKDKWYELYNIGTGKWEYIEPNDLDAGTLVDLEKGAHVKNYRIVQYDRGVSLDVGCIEHQEGMTYNDIIKLPANKVKNFPTQPNDPFEDSDLNPDGKNHNIDITISDLKPNASYVIWIRAARTEYNALSEPSDPIIITTNPIFTIPVEKPTIPVFTYYYPGDDYVDLSWDFKVGYNYYIKYGTKDNINSANKEIEIKPEDLFYSTYYKINELEQETMYYFWIKAETSPTEKISSDWSDSLAVKTLPYSPPEMPRGFGVKNVSDAVSIDSITYEWIMETDNENIEYILEISENIDYKGTVEINAGKVSEFKVSALRSNFRYYARLYAYDSKKNLLSEPTQIVTARTLRSKSDYDSDEYVEDTIKGDYIVREYINKDDVLSIRIQGVNADRFIQEMRNDNILDYIIDLLDAPASTKHIKLVISNRVFNATEQLKENIIIINPNNKLVLPSGIFQDVNTKNSLSGLNGLSNFDYEIIISIDNKSNPQIKADKYAELKTGFTGIKVGALKGQLYIPVYSFARPIQMIYNSPKINEPGEDSITGVKYNHTLGIWEKIETKTLYESDSDIWQLSLNIYTPGETALANYSRDKFDDISSSRYQAAINNVASVHPLKSISGGLFYPGKDLSIDDTVKFVLDVMDYDYDEQYLRAAFRSGIIDIDDMNNPNKGCTREKALSAATRIYELKTGRKASPGAESRYPFDDMNKVSVSVLNKVKFAVQNGFMSERLSDMLEPDAVILRGEFIGIIEKVLKLIGEI